MDTTSRWSLSQIYTQLPTYYPKNFLVSKEDEHDAQTSSIKATILLQTTILQTK